MMPPSDSKRPAAVGVENLRRLRAALEHYVIFPNTESSVTVTLWIAATHGQPAWEHATRLPIVSPIKRCGKSRLLDIIHETCHNPILTVNTTVPALVRSIVAANPPTLLVDEADAIFGTKRAAEGNEDLRAVLNAGHQRNRPVNRWDVRSRQLERLPSFAMAALASKGDVLPDTIMDRGPAIRMRRRAPGEAVAPFRQRRDAPRLRAVRDDLHAWVRGHLEVLAKAEPDMPVEDRDADNWEPLIAIADLAGGQVGAAARAAAVALAAGATTPDDDASLGLRLLADVRDVLGSARNVSTEVLLRGLYDIEEAPWAQYRYGKSMTARELAQLLKPFNVRSRDVEVAINGSKKMRKGYYLEDFTDPWRRYLVKDKRPEDTRDGLPLADGYVKR